jgi:hypothetical protein
MATETQSFEKHTRWDPPFHFFIVPVVLITTIAIMVRTFRDPSSWNLWMVVVALAGATAVLKIRLNALRVQDRLIRLEERLRMAAILPPALQARIPELTEGQCVGLRFASDAELTALVQRALDEKLGRKDIKKAIVNWRPDHSRV